MRRWRFHRILIGFSLFLLIISQFGLYRLRQSPRFKIRQHNRELHVKNFTDFDSSLFVYRAYYDDRALVGSIRVFLLAKCFGRNDSFLMRYNGMEYPLRVQPVEESCPWTWARNCQWNAHHLRSPKISGEIPEKISIVFNGNRSVEIPVEKRPPMVKGRLQVCVPPLYWYHDWIRLILFFEMWKKHSPTFIIYANSHSRNVEKVLEYYKKKGQVQIVNWPLLEKSNDGEDPNAGIYRLSHSLAHNDCVLRMKSEIGVLLDIDEYIDIKNGDSLLKFATQEFQKSAKVGSLMFSHSVLQTTPMNTAFGGVSNAMVANASGPPKTVFRTDQVKFLSTHWVHTHARRGIVRRKISMKDGALLHNRVRFDKIRFKNMTVLAKYDGGLNMSDVQRRCKTVAKTIFGKKMPRLNEKISLAMDSCDRSWRQRSECKVPLLKCHNQLAKTDNWVFLPPTEDSHYTIL